jgi:hypothetical protein
LNFGGEICQRRQTQRGGAGVLPLFR